MKKHFNDLMVVIGTWVACMWLLFYLSNLNQDVEKNVNKSIDTDSNLGYDEKELNTKYYITTGSQVYREVSGEEIESVALEELMLEVAEEDSKQKSEEVKRLNQLAKEKELVRLEEVKRKKEANRKQEELKAKEKVAKSSDSSKKSETKSKWRTFEATHYSAFCSTCSGTGKTASGVSVAKSIYYKGYRVIATNQNEIPMWSIVEIKTPSGTFEAVALDTGGFGAGGIDILVDSTKTAYKLGRFDVQVRIIGSMKK